jgi:hypothetical protein
MNSRFFTLFMNVGQNALSRGDDSIMSQNYNRKPFMYYEKKKTKQEVSFRKVFTRRVVAFATYHTSCMFIISQKNKKSTPYLEKRKVFHEGTKM